MFYLHMHADDLLAILLSEGLRISDFSVGLFYLLSLEVKSNLTVKQKYKM